MTYRLRGYWNLSTKSDKKWLSLFHKSQFHLIFLTNLVFWIISAFFLNRKLKGQGISRNEIGPIIAKTEFLPYLSDNLWDKISILYTSLLYFQKGVSFYSVFLVKSKSLSSNLYYLVKSFVIFWAWFSFFFFFQINEETPFVPVSSFKMLILRAFLIFDFKISSFSRAWWICMQKNRCWNDEKQELARISNEMEFIKKKESVPLFSQFKIFCSLHNFTSWRISKNIMIMTS